MSKTTSSSHSVSYLIQHEGTKPVMEKHLNDQLPSNVKVADLSYVHGTLTDMLRYNMGGGLPFEVITALIADLDKVKI